MPYFILIQGLYQTGLFSAVVATFISMSIQDIQADKQDTSNFYLASIHQALTGSNLSNISLPPSPPTFTPPTYGIWVNSLWFLSLVISMTCAVLANLLQQWARKYLKVTQPHSTASELRRARCCAFYADGVDKFLLPWVFEALPAMLHLSVFLFFAGLVVFLWNFDSTISKLVLSWVSGCVTLYGCITFIPTIYPESPYNTPLSPLAWSIVTGVPFLSLRVLNLISYFLNIVLHVLSFIRWCLLYLLLRCSSCLLSLCCFGYPHFLVTPFSIDRNRLAEAGDRYRKLFFQGMQKTAAKTALRRERLSRRAFMWTFDNSHAEDELESFFSNLPGFRKSNDDKDFLNGLTGDQKENLWSGLVGFLDRTFSDSSLKENDKNRRAKICADAFDPLAFSSILDSVVSEDQCLPVQSVKLAPFVGGLDTGKDKDAPMFKEAIVSCVVATAKLRDADWFTIASKELNVDTSDLLLYSPHDLSLAILIHVTCKQLHHFKDDSWPRKKFWKVLRAASKFEAQHASQEIQNGFCSLWNHVVEKVHDDKDSDGRNITRRYILRPIYKVFADIHHNSHLVTRSRFFARTRARTSDFSDILTPREYVRCAIGSHHLDLTSLLPHENNDTTLMTFANIRVAALAHTAAETTPAPPLVTTGPGASPEMSLATEPGAAAEDDGKLKHALQGIGRS
jgi:hypothetical protein